MTEAALDEEIASLERSLEAPSTAASGALAESLARRLVATSADAPPEARARAVRGLLVASHEIYREGRADRSIGLLAAAVDLATDLEPAARIPVVQRMGEMALLTNDVGAALEHTTVALDLAHANGRRVDEAHGLVSYGMALDAAGLYAQADAQWARALALIEGTEQARLRGNIWAMRCPLGFRLKAGGEAMAADACRRALEYALAAPARYRDSMACTALCNWAALEVQLGRLAQARVHLARAQACANVGARPRWLIDVVWAMAAVRERNDESTRAALDELLRPERAPAAVYVTETVSVLAAMYAHMGERERAGEALMRLATERARALWAMLHDPRFGTRDTSQVLERLAVTAELRDDATGKHCFRVGRLACLLGMRAGLGEATLEGLEIAARLHDIGKIVIPDAILLKPGLLDPTELHLMRTHTTIGAQILASGALPSLACAAGIARHHHERWDGTGYPDGLAGEAIPLAARVAALADVYDALTHARPYKAAWSHDDAISYIAGAGGTHFDPELVHVFVVMMREAGADLAAFVRGLESAAANSSYVLAQERVAATLRA